MNEKRIYLEDKDGNMIVFDVMASFEYKEENYVIYTCNEINDDGSFKAYASKYTPGAVVYYDNLRNITDEKEWMVVEKVLETIKRVIEEYIWGEIDEEQLNMKVEELVSEEIGFLENEWEGEI